MTNGGYWDKVGNSFEDRWALDQLVSMLASASRIESLEREPVGEDEHGVDLWVNLKDGSRECHQCKRGVEGRARWTMKGLSREGIFGQLRFQVDRDPEHHVYRLVTGTAAPDFESLLGQARDSSDSATWWHGQIQKNKRLRAAFSEFCCAVGLERDRKVDRERAWSLLRACRFTFYREDDHSSDCLAERLGPILEGHPLAALEVLETWLRRALRRRIDIDDVAVYLGSRGFRLLRGETDRFEVAAEALAYKRHRSGESERLKEELASLEQRVRGQEGDLGPMLGKRWKVIKLVGRGGFAELWLVEDQEFRFAGDRKPVQRVVKVLREDRATDPAMVARFRRGAIRARSVIDPRIARVLEEPIEVDGLYFYVMEFFDAPSLQDWIFQERMPMPASGEVVECGERGYAGAVWKVLSEVASGLSTLHRADLVHGDVKPRNILLDEMGRVKLCDFDLTEPLHLLDGSHPSAGTIPFAAPEVCAGGASSAQSDQYSFAATILATLLGDDWDRRGGAVDLKEELRALQGSVGLSTILNKGLAPEPSKRFESVEDLMTGLTAESFEGLVWDMGRS
jgi:hypothetical protein